MNATRRTVLIAGALSAIPALSFSSAVFAASDLVEVQSLNAANKPITVAVPKNPQRIAVADFSVLDTLDHWGLGERIVALPQTTALPYLPQYFKKSKKVTNLGTLKEIDLEGLMAAEPDVIFISGRLAKKYDELSKIAPVVFMTADHEKGTFKSFSDNLMNLAKIFGKEAAAQADIDHFTGRIDRIRAFRATGEHFTPAYAKRFQEGEFRRRVQFMYGGRLQKIRFRYTGPSIEAVLDRLPTAEILLQDDSGWTISAEVFGKGIEMWMRSQGDYIQEIHEKERNQHGKPSAN